MSGGPTGDGRVVVLNGVHFHSDQGTFHGEADDGTVYLLRVAESELAHLGNKPLEERQCPRCDFEEALCTVVYAGEYIQQHYHPRQAGQLNASEIALVDASRAWMVDDSISKCFDEAMGDDER